MAKDPEKNKPSIAANAMARVAKEKKYINITF